MAAMRPFPVLNSDLTATPSGRRWLLGATLGLALAVAGCTGPSGPRGVSLSLAQMQDKLATRFPRRYPVAGLVELNLQTPRLALRPARNRINAVMAVEASGPALRRTHTGSLDVDFALRFELSDQTVRATELQVNALQIDGLPAQASTLLAGLGPTLAQQALREVVIYQVRPRDLALADSLGLQPGRIIVTAQGLEIELAAKPQS
jgi:hypothetical protein